MEQDTQSPTTNGAPEPPSHDQLEVQAVEPAPVLEGDSGIAVSTTDSPEHRSAAAGDATSASALLRAMELALRSIDTRLGRLEAQLPQLTQPQLRDAAAPVGASWSSFQLLALATICLVVFL